MLAYIDNIIKKMELSKIEKIVKNKNLLNDKYINNSNEELKEIFLSLKEKKYDKAEALQITAELSKRFLGLNPYNSQLRAALVLNEGKIAELGTGEGKTLSIVLATLLNYLNKEKTHIVTANDYLVQRDFLFSKPLFDFIGIKSAPIRTDYPQEAKKELYTYDVLYTISSTLVFDYLNNNRIRSKDLEIEEVRECLIIDEIDFVLIDEARTPIVSTGLLDANVELYKTFQEIQADFKGVKKSEKNDTNIEEIDFFYKDALIELTDSGFTKLEKHLTERRIIDKDSDIYNDIGFSYISYLEKALRANYAFSENIHYIIIDGAITPINQQTGRPQIGNRFSGGLHQALEAKLGLEIKPDSQVFAESTIQNYFGKYKKLSGTTGTAETEAVEFKEFFGLRVLPIKPNLPSKRKDYDDLLFLNNQARINAIIGKVKENVSIGRPTLIGTQNLETSEILAQSLTSSGIAFNLLNAKNHEKEAEVIAQAGSRGVVTISTNMAGRGTDIMLGGNKDLIIQELIKNGSSKEEAESIWRNEHDFIVKQGGLSIIGIERGISRRLDNQLIGRAGRQGDAGETRFYLSLEDQLFESTQKGLLQNNWSKNDPNEGLSFGLMSKIVRESQKNVEGAYFSSRKNLFKFDTINAKQREIFYDWRKKILSYEKLTTLVEKYIKAAILETINQNKSSEDFLANDFSEIERDIKKIFKQDINIRDFCKTNKLEDEEDFINAFSSILLTTYNEKMSVFEPADKIKIEKDLLLRIMDVNYAENISSLDGIRKSSHLRAYAQKNPLDEYQKEALEMFSNLVKDIKKDFCTTLVDFSPLSYLNEEKERQEQLQQLKKEQESQSDQIRSNDITDFTVKRYRKPRFPYIQKYTLPKLIENVGI